jgi:hypothetical protein
MVVLEQMFDDLQIISSRQIKRPCIPIAEARLQPPKCRGADNVR